VSLILPTAWFIPFGHVTELVGKAGSGSCELDTATAWWDPLWSHDLTSVRGIQGLRLISNGLYVRSFLVNVYT
jgi:hypothetical protein